ncbi:hypothetical protein BBBOND_0305940 [Babesia bigemina]|uniref:Maf-like protein n=1 Tax=Babesia bigemina TaxID=5866 RepID=A0A061DDY4_BABBI|nr:hypothetical protein BBBOND_0305940 [Babesia bigemina]CDR96690.1 hypothetical protein BBBOND_0305940 [Babesia bigemina]|eukprot:XP_012768876.1 hypothetical protein BBBOND_0305940 [Babesia bigemina]
MADKTLMSLSKLFGGSGDDWILLASESDLRAYVLRQHLGITNILMLRSNFAENLKLEDGETAYDYTVKTADKKAEMVAKRFVEHEKDRTFRNEVRSPFGTVPDNFDFSKVKFIIGADTVAWCNDVVFGKPIDRTAAHDQLLAYQKYDPIMVTGVSIYVKDGEKSVKRVCSFYERTIVHFAILSEAQIVAYLDTEEYKGVAGSCNYTSLGETLVESIDGSYTAAVGIPTHQLAYELCNYLNRGTATQYLVDGAEAGEKVLRRRTKRTVGKLTQEVLTKENELTNVITPQEKASPSSDSESEEEPIEGGSEIGTTKSRRRREAQSQEPQETIEQGPVGEGEETEEQQEEVTKENESESEGGEDEDKEDEDEKEEESLSSDEEEAKKGDEEGERGEEGNEDIAQKSDEEDNKSKSGEDEDEEDKLEEEDEESSNESQPEEEEEEEEEEADVNVLENGAEEVPRSRNRRSASLSPEDESFQETAEETYNERSELENEASEDEFRSTDEADRESSNEEEFDIEEERREEVDSLTDETENGPEDVIEEELSSRPASPRMNAENEEQENGDEFNLEGEPERGVSSGHEEGQMLAEEEEPRDLTQEEQLPEGTEEMGEEEEEI